LNYFGVQGGGADATAASCTNSAGNRYWMLSGIIYHNSKVRITDVTDGTSNTYLVGETKYMSLRVPNPGQYYGWASSDWPLGTFGSPASVAGAVVAINTLASYTGSGATTHTFDVQTRTFGSNHPGGCFFALADGSVSFVTNGIGIGIYRAMGTRADGLPIGGAP